MAVLSAMLAYFLLRLDAIEKKVDIVENHIIRYMAKRSTDIEK